MRITFSDCKRGARPGQSGSPKPGFIGDSQRVARAGALAIALAVGTAAGSVPQSATAQEIVADVQAGAERPGETRRVTIDARPLTLSASIASLDIGAEPASLPDGATAFGVSRAGRLASTVALRDDGRHTFAIRGVRPGQAPQQWGTSIRDFITVVEAISGQDVAGFRILVEETRDGTRPITRVLAIPQNSAGQDIGQHEEGQLAVGGQIYNDAGGGAVGGFALISEPPAPASMEIVAQR